MKQLSTLQQILGKIYNTNSAPRISKDKPSHTRDTLRTLIDNIHITQEDIEGDLHEGRD